MTNSDALLRLCVNKHDRLAMMSLRDNNLESSAPPWSGLRSEVAGQGQPVLMQRIADPARLHEQSIQKTLTPSWRNASTPQCDRLRNEGVREKAHAG